MTKAPDMLAAALAYTEQGFAVFPVKDKKPLTRNGFKDASKDWDVVTAFWHSHPGADVAIATGAVSGIVVLDADSAEGEAHLLELCGGSVPATRIHTTGRGRHYLFRHPGGGIPSRVSLRENLDVRADGGYIVAPPSLHKGTGGRYRVVDPEVPIADLPSTLAVALLEKRDKRGPAPTFALEDEDKVPEGGRNAYLTRAAGKLRGAGGLGIGALRHLLHYYNATLCDPPLPDKEVDHIADSAAKWARGNTVVEELNKVYAIIQAGDRVRVLQERPDGNFGLLAVNEFKVLLGNHMTADEGGRRRPVADVWLASPHRRQYTGIVFEPGKASAPGEYNLFKGWAVVPRPGDCSLFLRHLKENICTGNAEHYSWVLGWFAHIVQKPAEKPGTALVLRGKQGTGKSITGAIVGHLLGRHYTSVATSERVIGRFNSHLAHCLLLQGDEAFWAGDKAGEGALKDLVTSSRQFIERKGIDAVELPNFVRLLITSNARWVVPAGPEERRFGVLDVAEDSMQDRRFFGALMRQMESGGYEALLHHLLAYDLSKVDVGRIPKTAALSEQKISSLPSELKWLLDLLMNGALPGDVEGTGSVSCATLHQNYTQHAQRIGFSRRSSETELGQLLRKFVPACKRRRVSFQQEAGGTKRIPIYSLPSLRECRQTFSEVVGQGFDWPDENEEWLASENNEWLASENDEF